MAIMRPSALAGRISGSLGNVVFVNSNRGTVVRIRPNPIRKATPLQSLQRRAYQECASIWNDLSVAERLSWSIAAANVSMNDRLGVARTRSPWPLFLAFNLWRSRQGQTVQRSFEIAAYTSGQKIFFADFRYGGPFLVSQVLVEPLTGTYADVRTSRSFSTNPLKFYPAPRLIRNFALTRPDTNVFLQSYASSGLAQPLEYLAVQINQLAWPRGFADVTRLVAQIPNESASPIVNPGFETAWTGPLSEGWSKIGPAVMTQNAVDPFGDLHDCHVVFTPVGGQTLIQYDFADDVDPGISVRIRWAMKVVSGTLKKVWIYNPPNATFTFVQNVAAGSWIRYDFPYTFPGHASLVRWVFDQTGGSACEIAIDNVDARIVY